jgi:hypothetical protein
MGTRKVHEVPEGRADQSRREALKRFGRYAAAAPAAMILLQPHRSEAGILSRIITAVRARRAGGGGHY